LLRGKYILVSYHIKDDMPIFKGNMKNRIKKVDSFETGQNWNSFVLNLFNHNGTHIDGPLHFDKKGRGISDYNIAQFIFNKPFIADIPKIAGEAISADDLSKIDKKSRSCDLLLIRTGFYRRRSKSSYVENNPWVAPSAADYIRKKYDKLKAIGIDTVSIASFPNLEQGGQAHQMFLKKGSYNSSPIMIIEDLNLGAIPGQIKRFFAIPLLIRGIDSAPCTAFAEV